MRSDYIAIRETMLLLKPCWSDSLRRKELAISLEYFHTASLTFDALPCMDDAVERRGAPCVHVEFGEPSAILAVASAIASKNSPAENVSGPRYAAR